VGGRDFVARDEDADLALSRRRIASPSLIGTMTPRMSMLAFIAWLLSWSSRA
jgi:hypothetical protein